MLRKLTFAVGGALLLAGGALAQTAPMDPSSITEAGPNYVVPTGGQNPFLDLRDGRWTTPEPSQISESDPAQMAGQHSPGVERAFGATGGSAGGAVGGTYSAPVIDD